MPIKPFSPYLPITLLIGILLFGCQQGQSERSSEISDGISADATAGFENAQESLSDKKQAISSILLSYYQDLEAEKISINEYYAPTVSTFFKQKDLPRSEIKTIINRGFESVEDRRIRLDQNSLVLTRISGGYEVIFEGDLSFMNAKGDQVAETFKNKVIFNDDLQITSYESLGNDRQVAPRTNSVAQASPSDASVLPLLKALKNNDYTAVQEFIHPELGYYYITRPGAFDAVYYFSQASAMERQANTPWISELFSKIDCEPQESSKPDFNCEGFSKEGCFLAETPSYDRVGKLMKALTEYEYAEYSKTDLAAAAKVEDAITHEFISTKDYISLSLGLIDGKWYILVVDPAVYDCSA